MDPRVRIHIESHRHRLCDPDGISAKAAIDGLIDARILPNDSTKEVESVTYSQKSVPRKSPEITIITIKEVSNINERAKKRRS